MVAGGPETSNAKDFIKLLDSLWLKLTIGVTPPDNGCFSSEQLVKIQQYCLAYHCFHMKLKKNRASSV